MVGLIMKDNNKKLSLLIFYIIGLIISALLGLAVSQQLLSKSELNRIRFFWKYTIFYYFIISLYIIWYYFLKSFNPLILNVLKFLGISFLFSFPYFIVLTKAVPINSILVYLPPQIIFLTGLFIFFIIMHFKPEMEDYISSISIILGFAIIFIFITTFFGMSNILALYLICIIILSCSLFLLKKVIDKNRIKTSQFQAEAEKDKKNNSI